MTKVFKYNHFNVSNTLKDVLPHDFKPEIFIHQKLKTETDNTMTLGLEIEVERRYGEFNSEIEQIYNKYKMYDMLYCVHDGSLENGFEVVTQPHSLKAYKHFGNKERGLNTLLEDLDNLSLTSYSSGNCGLHVHIDKKFISKADFCKLSLFFSNSTKNIVDFSGRIINSNFQRYCPIANVDVSNIATYLLREDNGNKYRALAERENTIEFRIFRGSLNPARVKAYLQFVESLVYFVKAHSLLSQTWDKYIKWLNEKAQSEYKFLNNYLKNKELHTVR